MLNNHATNANERLDPSALQEVADLKPAHATAYGFCGFDFPCPVGMAKHEGFWLSSVSVDPVSLCLFF